MDSEERVHYSLSAATLRLVLALVSAAGCQIDEHAPTANHVAFDLDGEAVPVDQRVTLAYIDETKQLAGPNTHLLLTAGTRSNGNTEFDTVLQINLPPGLAPGSYPTRFKYLPDRDDVWVSYYEIATENYWTAYEGQLEVQEVGGVGGRLRMSFDNLKLSNPCAEERALTNGSVDVRIGSEDSFAQGEIATPGDTGSAAGLVESDLVITLDDKVFACPFAEFSTVTEPSADSEPVTMLSGTAPCICVGNGTVDAPQSSFVVSAELPLSEADVDSEFTALDIFEDVLGTPYDLHDDAFWVGLDTPSFDWHAVGKLPGDPVDIEVGPDTFAYVVSGSKPTIDRSREKTMARARFYGEIEEQ